MLIIVCGSEGIHKKFLARKVIAAVNDFQIADYKIDFNCYPFKVYDSDNNIVFQSTSKLSQKYSYSEKIVLDDADLDPTLYGQGINYLDTDTTEKILHLEDKTFLSGLKYYRDVFSNSALDYGLFDEKSITDFEADNIELGTSYIDLINCYKNRTYKNFVVCGSFGKTYLEKIAKEIGTENIIVLNITRNPSVSWCVHQKPDSYYELEKSKGLEGFKGDIEKYLETTLASISIRDLDYVHNIKFENMIEQGLQVLDKKVTLPLGYESFNGMLTQYEITHLIPKGYANAEIIQNMNDNIGNFIMTKNFDIDIDIPSNANQYFPSNFFDVQDYTPLSYAHIISKR